MNEIPNNYYRVTENPAFIEKTASKPYKEHSAKTFLSELHKSIVQQKVEVDQNKSQEICSIVDRVVKRYDERLGLLGIIGDIFQRLFGSKTERKEIQDLQTQIKNYLKHSVNTSNQSNLETEEISTHEEPKIQPQQAPIHSSIESSGTVNKKMLFDIKQDLNKEMRNILKWNQKAIELSENFEPEQEFEESNRVMQEDQEKLARQNKPLEDYLTIIDDLRVYGNDVLAKLLEKDPSYTQIQESFKNRVDLFEQRVAQSYLMQNDRDKAYDVIFNAYRFNDTTQSQVMLGLLESIINDDLEHNDLDKAYGRFDRLQNHINKELVGPGLIELLTTMRDRYSDRGNQRKADAIDIILRKYSKNI